MSDSEHLSPGTLVHLIDQVRTGKGDEQDARRLLAEFVTCAFEENPIPPELLEHLRDAFTHYLSNPAVSLEQSLGVKRTKRGPRFDEQLARRIAAAIWERRVRLGTPHQTALEDVADILECGTTKAGEAWRVYATDGLEFVRMSRILSSEPWSPVECQRIRAICNEREIDIPSFARE